jgi:hypothetical protein
MAIKCISIFPQKFTQIGNFGLKINHLATLLLSKLLKGYLKGLIQLQCDGKREKKLSGDKDRN